MEKTMMDYINETPSTMADIIDNSYEYTKDLVDFYTTNKCEGLCLIASGSSYNGSNCALSFMKHILNEDIRLITPFTLIHHEIDYLKNQMMIGVSQSGCSTNTIEAIRKLKEKGYKTSCLVGRDDCDVKDVTDLTLNWHVNEEKIGFVTKGVNSPSCFLMVFAIHLAKARNIIDEQRVEKLKSKLKETCDIHPQMVDSTIKSFIVNKDVLTQRKKMYFISSGPNLAVAIEGALKIAETSCISATAVEAEEFLHGPLYPLTPEDIIIAIDNNEDASSKRIIDIAIALQDICENVFLISNTDRFDETHTIKTKDQTCLHRSPLYRLACVQTLAYLMTEATNNYEPHEKVKEFKKANKVASKSRSNLYMNLQKI